MCERRPQRPILSRIPGLVASLLLLIFSSPAFAAPVTENWVDEDYGFVSRMMAADRDGDLYVLGDTAVGDYLVIKKFSAGGALLWQTPYRPASRLRGVWIAVDSAKNAVVVASIIQGSSGDPAGWVTLKLDAQGTVAWADALPGGYADVRRVAIDPSDNIYVAGRMWLTGSVTTSLDSVLVKYGPDGARQWARSFDDGGTIDEPYAMAVSPDGMRIGIAGVSGHLFMALMYDPAGNRLWARTDVSAYAANDIAFGPGNAAYFATGTYHSQDADPYQMAIARFDDGGTLTSLRSYRVGDRALRVRVDSRGHIVAAGMDSVGYIDWMTIKTDAAGNLLWSRRYDGGRNNQEMVEMLVLGPDDSVYVTGSGGPNPSSGVISYLKGVVVKYAGDGAPQWAVFDPYSGGKALVLGAGNTFATLGFGYLVTTHYTQTGELDAPPAAPTGLSANPGTSSVNLSFADNAGNEFWVEIERCTGTGCTNFVKVAQSRGENAIGATDSSGVTRGTTYTYRARAVGFMGASAYSNTVTTTVPAVSLPAPPSELAATASESTVTLTWKNNATNAIQFYIDRCQGAGCTDFVGLGASATTTWTDYGVVAGATYTYRVRAWNPDGYSAYSNTATATVAGAGTTPGTPTAAPAAPVDLVGSAQGKTGVRLAWKNGTGAQDAVKIERCRGNGCTGFAQVATVSGTATSYVDSGLSRNTEYRYRVRSHNAAGDSAFSNVANVRTSSK